MTSFRRRLQHSSLALIVLLLVTLDIAVYWGFLGVLHHYVDSRLKAMAEGWADIAGRNLGMLLDASQKGQEAEVRSAVPDEDEQIEMREAALSIQILSSDGTVFWRGAAVTAPSVDPELLSKVSHGEEVFETVRDPAGKSVRRVWVPLRQQGQVQYILQAETTLRFMEKALNGLAALLAGASALVLLLAWWGSNWLARQALTPVEVLSETARKISEPSSLGTRLSLDAPYEEFQSLAQAFNTMMDRIQRVVEGQRRFVTDAAHEIQTPLTALKGNLEVAFRKTRNAAEYRDILISNLGAVERLINLCRSLITLARLAGQDAFASAQPAVPLQPVLQELIDELTVLAQDRGITLTLDVEPALTVSANKEQLQRVFFNLLDNALRHTPPGGVIAVRAGFDDDRTVIVVSDTGEGIPKDHVPHIFERFYRADGARSRESGGVGLGLAIVKEIVETHNGEITVFSKLGQGTTFTIRFHRDRQNEQRLVG
ncbi:MAG TPA: ATP-binding protein [Nitrospiraceae bacterium]|nr:ATP-binding protein [Nitrospiraceae bacterium]